MKLSQIVNHYKPLRVGVDFVQHFASRCRQDQIQVSAGYLSYVTLMSLVPLVMVVFSIITAFPVFAEFKQDIENFIFTNFVPAASESIQENLNGFVNNASQMSATAILALMLLSMLLISSIDKALNRIWRVYKPRKTITSFAIYWMILTLGPVLVGISIAATSYMVSLVSFGGQEVNNFLLKALPFFASWMGFVVLYLFVPNTDIKLKHAFVGSLAGAALFELAKKIFSAYITHLPSYEAIYGALAAIPILFVWVYVSWLVVFVGAEFTVCLDEFDVSDPVAKENEPR
ncbi:virulence factor BrkB family protein [Thalassotalea maritima]|uniref:virulence factor BrkB family protein n=1 Tax=Thalassotalea maritima TaxID=3242416 RepID=UPI0035291568